MLFSLAHASKLVSLAAAALKHAASTTIFDEPGGQALVLDEPRGNAAHNGRRNGRLRRATPHSAQHGGVSMRAHACASGWVRVRAEYAAMGQSGTEPAHAVPKASRSGGPVTHALALGHAIPLLAFLPFLRAGVCCTIA